MDLKSVMIVVRHSHLVRVAVFDIRKMAADPEHALKRRSRLARPLRNLLARSIRDLLARSIRDLLAWLSARFLAFLQLLTLWTGTSRT